MSFFALSETEAAVNKIQHSGSKEILKTLNTSLSKALNNTADPILKELITALINFTEAAKDMYAPNVMRYMMKRDSYIIELIGIAKKIEEVDIPTAEKAATSLNITQENCDLIHFILISLIAFQKRNIEKQMRIDNHKGNMVENTTHDIMQKYMKKNFNHVAELVSTLIKIIQTKIITVT